MHEIDPTLLDDDNVRAALATRDVGALYRLLRRLGVIQRKIAGRCQPVEAIELARRSAKTSAGVR